MISPSARQKGSSAIEAAISSTLIVMIITSGLSVSYFIFARQWLERASYETVICLASDQAVRSCEKVLFQSTKSALPIGVVSKIRSMKTRKLAKVEVTFSIGKKEVIRVRDHRVLPLKVVQK